MALTVRLALRRARPWLSLGLLLVFMALFVAACATQSTASLAPGQTAGPSPSATLPAAAIPLHPATPTDPLSLVAFLFTPIFQALFISLVAVEQATGSMVLAIIAVTLMVRVILIPLYRKQIVSQKRMQLLNPELKEIQKRYKGDRAKTQEATQAFYKERGVNPAQGCLPLILQFVLLIPMYSVFSSGLQNYDPTRMLTVFGVQVVPLTCPATPSYNAAGHVIPCIDSTIHLLGYTIDLSQPSVLFTIGIGISLLAIISSLLQLVQSRMTLPRRDATIPDDQNTKIQRQSMLFLPFISIFYGGFLPAGLFIYWIVSTLFSIVQQYLIIGWGGMFPLFNWDPLFAREHKPRFPVAIPTVDPAKRAPNSVLATDERAAKAATTIRPRERSGRQGRRGRRR